MVMGSRTQDKLITWQEVSYQHREEMMNLGRESREGRSLKAEWEFARQRSRALQARWTVRAQAWQNERGGGVWKGPSPVRVGFEV